jgi:hypothetical protein
LTGVGWGVMGEAGERVSVLWRAGIEADIARGRRLSAEELLAEIRVAGWHEAEGIAAVKAGRGTMRARSSPEEGAAEPAGTSQKGAGSAIEGVAGIPEAAGAYRNASGHSLLQLTCPWCGRLAARHGRQKFCSASCRVAAWQAATGYRRKPATPSGELNPYRLVTSGGP